MLAALLESADMAKSTTTEQVSVRLTIGTLRRAREYAQTLEFRPSLGRIIDHALEMYLDAKGAPVAHPPRAPRHKQP